MIEIVHYFYHIKCHRLQITIKLLGFVNLVLILDFFLKRYMKAIKKYVIVNDTTQDMHKAFYL